MKLVSLAFASFAFAASASAQYFSDGWQPGQAATPTHEGAAQFTPGVQPEGEPAGAPSQPRWTRFLTEGPVGSLLEKAGINMTERLAEAQAAAYSEIWDSRIPLIHDHNYEEVIVNEPLTPEEERDRVWFLIISTAAGQQQQGGVSKLLDTQFDGAYNTSLIENDLPSVRWGRIDYINVTYLTTKWNIWRGPFLVVLKDRGQTLRFYHANQARLNSTVMRNFLKEEGWKNTEPWTSSFAPGGSNEFVLHYVALGLQKLYDVLIRIPKFVLMIITGGLGSVIMGLLHKSETSKKAEQPPQKPAVKPKPATKPVEPATPTASPSKKGSAKHKKGGKK